LSSTQPPPTPHLVEMGIEVRDQKGNRSDLRL